MAAPGSLCGESCDRRFVPGPSGGSPAGAGPGPPIALASIIVLCQSGLSDPVFVTVPKLLNFVKKGSGKTGLRDVPKPLHRAGGTEQDGIDWPLAKRTAPLVELLTDEEVQPFGVQLLLGTLDDLVGF